MSLAGLRAIKGDTERISTILKSVIELTEYWKGLNQTPLIPNKYLDLREEKISILTRVYTSPTFYIPDKPKGYYVKDNVPDVLIMENMKTSLSNLVDRANGNSSREIVYIFIKPRA